MCQFLLGTVQRKMFKSAIEFLETTECQFLLGTVQPTLVEDPSFSVRYAVSCQFLLGTVQLSSYLQQK